MPGEIDEESIIENKPAIKSYWETKMRENAASQFARSNFGVTSPTITDKINDEIREDYMRNLELMHDEGLPRSSDSDTSDEPIEFDSFDMASSSNGSSPFGQPNDASSPLIMSESPTLIDSGHQSQESHLPPDNDLSDRHLSFDGNVGQNRITANAGYNNFNGNTKPVPQTPTDQQGGGKKSLGNVRVGPIVTGYRNASEANRQAPTGQGKIENHVTHYITFNKPFSRPAKTLDEPRIQEREKSPPKSLQTQKEVKETKEAKEPVEDKFVSLSLKTSQESPLKSAKTDISYMLAASRLKKEIEDNLKRERELKDEGRVRTLSVDTVPSAPSDLSSPSVEVSTQLQPRRLESEEPEAEEKVERNVASKTLESPPRDIKNKNDAQAQVKKFEAIAAQTQLEQQQQQLKPMAKRESPPAAKPQPAAQQQPAAQHVPAQQPQVSQVQHPRPPLPSFKIGKNFNSMERYIMYSSLTKLNLRSMPSTPTNTVFSPAADASLMTFDVDPIETTETQGSSNEIQPFKPEKEETSATIPEPAEKIRKNYIPTEKKIKDELLEMVQREEELKKTRQQWKSTPNLSNLNLSEDEEEELEEVQLRQVPTKRVAEKRRRSALISKWEEMISKYNQ